MKQFIKDLRANPIFWLGIFIPIVLIMHWSHAGSNSLMFLLSLLAIIPLGGFISHATEGVAAKTGDTIGGLLNATLGNLTELVIVIAAIKQGLVELVKASLAGVIVTNSLFLLGMCFLIGGVKTRVQQFNRINALIQTSLLFIVCIALLVPTIVVKTKNDSESLPIGNISLGISIILLVVYILSLIFSLKTHVDFFKSVEQEGGEHEDHWSLPVSATVLAISAICIAVVSEIFVEAVGEAATSIGLSQAFVGFIIIPLVGAAAEMMTVFSAAAKNKLDISMAVTMGSSTQVSMFITPLLVILSYFIAPSPMDLEFRGGLIFMILFATLSVFMVVSSGKTAWYLGIPLLAVYAIFGLTLFFL
ncbi:MAG TPA: calcium/proton exchanger [Chitinophagaceae bacterium]